jgi:hypothetical protein
MRRAAASSLILFTTACAPLASRQHTLEPAPRTWGYARASGPALADVPVAPAPIAVAPAPVTPEPVVVKEATPPIEAVPPAAQPPPAPEKEEIAASPAKPEEHATNLGSRSSKAEPPTDPSRSKGTEARPARQISFYSFSDQDIAALRKRSREFRKLHDQLKSCTAKSEKVIAKREQLRAAIIELQNKETHTSYEEKKLAKLRADERRMKSDRSEVSQCQSLESRATSILTETYGEPGGEVHAAREN